MYKLTDYRLILTKDTKDRPDLSADPSGTALARTSCNSKLQTSRRTGRLIVGRNVTLTLTNAHFEIYFNNTFEAELLLLRCRTIYFYLIYHKKLIYK
jgi:hypothetical protein